MTYYQHEFIIYLNEKACENDSTNYLSEMVLNNLHELINY